MEKSDNNTEKIDPPGHGKLHLQYLPAFASYLLHHNLHEFVTTLLRISREEDLPLLRYFSSYSEEEMVELGKASNTVLLTLLSENNLSTYIEKSTRNFINNHIANITREDVLAEDITLVSWYEEKHSANF
ncbi:MAG: hypothetical protein WKI04_10685 [Ferruginibacter sp.]